MWRKYFKLVGLVPGKVITQSHGTVDFSTDVPVETCKELFELDFKYLEITDEGKEKLYGIKAPEAPSKGDKKESGPPEKRKRSSPTKRTVKKRKTSK